MFSTKQLLECADREVKQRERVYRRLVETGKMKQVDADREIAMMTIIGRVVFRCPDAIIKEAQERAL